MKTQSVKAGDIKKNWFVIDAADQSLGRMATQIARVLRGKHKPNYTPHLDGGDNVIVINASKVRLTGRKLEQKKYYRYTNYIGGLKTTRADAMVRDNPELVIKAAVKGMLPHNSLGRKVAKNLWIYNDAEHGHQAQKPVALPEHLVGKGN